MVLGTAFLRSGRGTQPSIAGKAVEGQDQGAATERGSREPLVTSRQTCLQLSGVQCELSTQTQPGHAVPSEVALRERQKDWLGLGVRDVAFFF